jgi:hypothetical protein
MPGRGKIWAEKLLGDYTGIVQCDGYGAYKHIEAADRKAGAGTLAFCWAHVRRGFFDEAKSGNAPVAEEVLRRIAKLYEIEARIRGTNAEHRRAVRQAESAIVIADMQPWLRDMLPKLPRGSKTAEAIGYMLNHWNGLIRFLGDGRIELDNNTVERSIRPLTISQTFCPCRARRCRVVSMAPAFRANCSMREHRRSSERQSRSHRCGSR